MSEWMRRLAAHYGRFRSEYPEDQLLIVFDIDGTIPDMRHMVAHVLLSFGRAHGSAWFHGLTGDDITVHENHVDQLLRDMALPAPVAERAYRWYLEQRWLPEAVLAAHRPYQGVLHVIRWFQIQPDTSVALNTGRPEHLPGGHAAVAQRAGRRVPGRVLLGAAAHEPARMGRGRRADEGGRAHRVR